MYVKFGFEILSNCWENCKKIVGVTFLLQLYLKTSYWLWWKGIIANISITTVTTDAKLSITPKQCKRTRD